MASRQDEIKELETVIRESKILITRYKNDVKELKSKLKDKEELIKQYKKSYGNNLVYITDLISTVQSYMNKTGYEVTFHGMPNLNNFIIEVLDKENNISSKAEININDDHLDYYIENALRDCAKSNRYKKGNESKGGKKRKRNV